MYGAGEMKHIDLFSGIGGFALACKWVGIETICFCENDKFCQKILKKHWPNVPIIKDVNDVEEIKQVVAERLTLLQSYDILLVEGKDGISEKQQIRSCGEPLSSRDVNSGHSRLLSSHSASDVENTTTERLRDAGQSPIPTEKSFLSGNDSQRQGAKPIRASYTEGSRSEKRQVRTMRKSRNLQGWANNDTSPSYGLSEAIGSNVVMSEMSSQLAQNTQSEELKHEEETNGIHSEELILTAGFP